MHVQDAPGHVRRSLARPYGAWKVAWRHFQHGKTKWVLERLRPRAIASHQLVPHSSEKAATAVLRHENSPAATAPSQVHGLGVKAGHEGRNMSDVRLHWEACVWQRVALKRHVTHQEEMLREETTIDEFFPALGVECLACDPAHVRNHENIAHAVEPDKGGDQKTSARKEFEELTSRMAGASLEDPTHIQYHDRLGNLRHGRSHRRGEDPDVLRRQYRTKVRPREPRKVRSSLGSVPSTSVGGRRIHLKLLCRRPQ